MRGFSIFPQSDREDLKDLAFGVYQVNQSKLYTIQHLEQNNNEFVVFQFNKETLNHSYFSQYVAQKPELVMMEITSRFVANKHWLPYVLFTPYVNEKTAILSYCFNCKVGKRTVGMCSHVMCILFYFISSEGLEFSILYL